MSGVTLTLSGSEIAAAANVGVWRNLSAAKHNRALEPGREDSGFERHILGAIAEYAFARYRNVCWIPQIGTLDTETGDVAGGFQIKATLRANGSLIVRPHDPAEFRYVLATLNLPSVRLVGWIHGDDARTPEHWRDRNPAAGIHRAAYFVPQARLYELELLAA